MIYQRTPRLATEEPDFSARPGAAHPIQRSDKEKSVRPNQSMPDHKVHQCPLYLLTTRG